MNKDVLSKIVRWGLYICPLAILLYINNLIYPLVTLKVFGFHILVELTVAAWVALAVFHKEYRPRLSKLVGALGLFLAMLALASLTGVNLHRSFWSIQERAIGVFSLLHFYAYFLVLTAMRRHINWRSFMSYLFGLGFIVGFFAIIQKIAPTVFEGSDARRPGSFMGNPAFLAPYLMFNMFIGAWLARTSQRKGVKIWLWLGIATLALVILLGQTRGALVGLVLGAVSTLGYIALRKLKPFSVRTSIIKNIPLLGIAAMIVFGGVFFATRSAAVWQKVPGLNRLAQISSIDATVGNRLIAWKTAIDIIKTKPLLGYGWENFKYPFDQRYNPVLLRTGFAETYWDKPHNVYLEILATSGVVGFLAYVLLIGLLIRTIIRFTPVELRPFALGALIAYLAQNFFVFDAFGSYLMLMAFIAFIDQYVGDRHVVSSEVGSLTVGKKVAGSCLVGVVVAGLLVGVVVNSKIVYANHLQFWGLNYFVNRMPDKAVESYKEGISLNEPYQHEISQSMVSALSQMVQQQEISNTIAVVDYALAQFDKVIQADPNNYYLYIVRADAGMIFQNLDKKYFKLIEENIRKAMSISPNRQQTYYMLSKLRLLEGDKKGALKEMQSAIDLDPVAADPHFFYGLLSFEIGDQKKGFEEIELAKSKGRNPNTAPEARIVAGYYGDAENYEEAARLYRLALKYSEADYESELKLGVVLAFTGQNAEAATYLRQFLSHVPDFFRNNPNAAQFKPVFEALGVSTK